MLYHRKSQSLGRFFYSFKIACFSILYYSFSKCVQAIIKHSLLKMQPHCLAIFLLSVLTHMQVSLLQQFLHFQHNCLHTVMLYTSTSPRSSKRLFNSSGEYLWVIYWSSDLSCLSRSNFLYLPAITSL